MVTAKNKNPMEIHLMIELLFPFFMAFLHPLFQ
jgi:hypothetical protein